jgi:hypothetical protein
LELKGLETDSLPARLSDEERGTSFDFRFLLSSSWLRETPAVDPTYLQNQRSAAVKGA